MVITQESERPAGWRARIGTVIPVSNTTNETEFNRMKPDGVTVHFTRVALHSDPAADDFATMLDDVERASGELAAAGADVIAYGCTSGSMACPADRLIGRMERASGKPSLSTAGAILDALSALGVRRVAVATPYTDATNEKERAFLERNGVEVAAIAGLGLGGSLAKIQKISRVPPRDVYAHARAVDRPDAGALLICCTDFGTADVLQPLENELGKPVLSSNSATFRAALLAAGVAQRIEVQPGRQIMSSPSGSRTAPRSTPNRVLSSSSRWSTVSFVVSASSPVVRIRLRPEIVRRPPSTGRVQSGALVKTESGEV